jgi:phosphatidylserine/phosphatidylglycerophosphate/cardiolipin synthase-like enzyme
MREELRRRLDMDRLRRLGAALWFRAGARLSPRDLDWAVPLLGEGGDLLIWEALREAGVLDSEGRIRPDALAAWLGDLAGERPGEITPRLVWTLPEAHPSFPEHGNTYLQAVLETVDGAREELVMTSPFIHERGIHEIFGALIRALKRGVRLTVLTHAADDLSSPQSVALEAIRREAERIQRRLIVYSVSTADRGLLHAKLVIADGERMILGSANLTGPGLTSNLEAGVVLGSREALTALRMIRELIAAGLAVVVFSVGHRT